MTLRLLAVQAVAFAALLLFALGAGCTQTGRLALTAPDADQAQALDAGQPDTAPRPDTAPEAPDAAPAPDSALDLPPEAPPPDTAPEAPRADAGPEAPPPDAPPGPCSFDHPDPMTGCPAYGATCTAGCSGLPHVCTCDCVGTDPATQICAWQCGGGC